MKSNKEEILDFRSAFAALTKRPPFDWQVRLFEDYFSKGRLPRGIDVPTGLGKTSVMALWLIARACKADLPRRLVYVVDRRAVVDQATQFAETLRSAIDDNDWLKQALNLEGRLPISTLRGQYADNREWLEDPTAPAIIIGTVDMVGSRLLFEGYGVSRKMRPYHAGFLGCDALVILDESHLVPPFVELLSSIETDVKAFRPQDESLRRLVPNFMLLPLSATGRGATDGMFQLEPCDWEGDETVQKRLSAVKSLTICEESGESAPALAEAAWHLASDGTSPTRCLIFCDKREIAEKVHELLSKKTGAGGKVEMLVGARRIRERQEVAGRLDEWGFFADSKSQPPELAFLIATSAGEVGIDLDAEHMVCDLVAWERMVQRLGRVNRLGIKAAQVRVLCFKPDEKKPELELRLRAVRNLLECLPKLNDGTIDASPGALRGLKQRTELEQQILQATTPAPLRPSLNRALVDTWSLTTLRVENPGRPEILPWLRGWIDEKPQTVVAWRHHLPAREGQNDVRGRYLKEINKFFEAAPIHLTEQLETETYRVVDWLLSRATDLSALLTKDEVVAYVLDTAGELISSKGTRISKKRDCLRMRDLVNLDKEARKALKDELLPWLAEATLVVDSRIQGLRRGLLSQESTEAVCCVDDGSVWVDTGEMRPIVGFRVRNTEQPRALKDSVWPERYRFAMKTGADGLAYEWLVVEKFRQEASNEDDRSTGFNQTLQDHQMQAERMARQLADKLALPVEYKNMLSLSAKHHDEGKSAANWQRAFHAPLNLIYAKTKGPIDFELLAGYRHEFGSLPVAEAVLREHLSEELCDLALHLIAAHHGQARPSIRTDGCPDAPPSLLVERAKQVTLRFARLQSRWGPWGLAWWESLLRAVDQKASRRAAESDSSVQLKEGVLRG